VILLSLEYDQSVGESPYFLLVFFAAHVVAMSSTVYNPFLYAWMNDNFRKEFRRVFPCLRTPTICRGATESVPTLPVATRVNAKHISPSRYSTAAGQTDAQIAGSTDRHRSGSGRGGAPRAAVCMHADEQEVQRFINGSDDDRENNYDNNEDENDDNAGVERSANGANDSNATERPKL